jgi:hypothetical protein
MKLRVLIPIIFFMSFNSVAQSAECNGDLQVEASSQCNAPLIESWKKHIVPLYKTGELNLATDSVSAECTCDGGAGTNTMFCTATYTVHSCMVDKNGAVWYSKHARIVGATNSQFSDSVKSENVSKKLQDVSVKVAENAAINLKNEVLKRNSKSDQTAQ